MLYNEPQTWNPCQGLNEEGPRNLYTELEAFWFAVAWILCTLYKKQV